MFNRYILIVAVPVALIFALLSGALYADATDAADTTTAKLTPPKLSPPSKHWKSVDTNKKVDKKLLSHKVFSRKCNAKNKNTCPMINIKIKSTSEQARKSYLDKVIVSYIEGLENRSHKDIDYEILELGKMDTVRVTSKRKSHRFIHLISITERDIHYYEYSGADKYFTRHQKDFKTYWAGRMRAVEKAGRLAKAL